MKKTEMRNPDTMHIDAMSVSQMLECMQRENLNAMYAVGWALPQIEAACELACANFASGGRLVYVGAGTSGRLGVLDAAECPPTFGVAAGEVIAIMAGGAGAMFVASEGTEDDADAGRKDILNIFPRRYDTVVGISAAGDAAYVVSALRAAAEKGCSTIGLTCNGECRLSEVSDVLIVTDTGAEAVTGSTRMKAGSAHKAVLNMLSTAVMIRTGKVYENLMINLKPSNKKLRARMIRIVCEIVRCTESEAEALLNAEGWSIRRVADRFDHK